MKPIGPFKFIRNDAEGRCLYRATFPLADDGCPNSEQTLIVEITTEGDHADVGLYVESRSGRRTVVEAETQQTDALSRVLYGAAKLVTTQYFKPL